MIRERRVFHPERGWGTVVDGEVAALHMRRVKLVPVRFDDDGDVVPALADSLHFGPLSRAQVNDMLTVIGGDHA